MMSSSFRALSPSCSARGAIIWAPAAATSCSTATTRVSWRLHSVSASDTCHTPQEINTHVLYTWGVGACWWSCTCGPKLRAAGPTTTSVPGMRRRIFLQNCLISEQDVSRSLSRTARPELSWPADRKALSRATSTAIQSRALCVNCRDGEQQKRIFRLWWSWSQQLKVWVP